MPHERLSVATCCPAKLNLSLAVTGRREDGFHELASVVGLTEFGDKFVLQWDPQGDPGTDKVLVRGLDIPGEQSSVAKAIRLFRTASGVNTGAFFCELEKKIPAGAGLGGGSSDAVAALQAMASIFPREAKGLDLAGLAARIGSDCPLFLHSPPVLMEGRGEWVSPLPENLAQRIRGRRVALFMPPFSINTAEAYRRLAAGSYYAPPETGKRLLAEWASSGDCLPPPWNDFQRLAADWLPGIEVVLRRLRGNWGLDARLSGSGSACFAFHDGEPDVIKGLNRELQSAWGDGFWMVDTVMK